jgi:hypothetical protein
MHLLTGPQALEGLLDRPPGHRGEPETLDRRLLLGRLVDVGEDQLPLAARVAGVDHEVDVLARHQPVDGVQLLLGAIVVRHELELLGDDREIRVAPLLQLGVIGVRLRQPDEVPHCPRDHVVLALEARLVLRLGEAAGECPGDVPGHGRLLCDDQCLAHEPPTVRGRAPAVF